MTSADVLAGERLELRTRDGRRLTGVAAGTGPVTVLLEAGLGAGSSSWFAVWDGLAEQARVVAYDRSGLRGSEPDRASRTLTRMTDDLEDVLVALGGGPFVLVGHSLGGLLVRAVAVRRPEQVQGLVLCDPAQEDAPLYYRTAYRLGMAATTGISAGLARLGLQRSVVRAMLRKELGATAVSEEVLAVVVGEMGSVAGVAAARAEARHLVPGLRQLAAERPVPDVPMTVISGTHPQGRGGGIRRQLNEHHRLLAQLAPGGRHVLAADSGHLVPQRQPQLVIDEVLRLVASDQRHLR